MYEVFAKEGSKGGAEHLPFHRTRWAGNGVLGKVLGCVTCPYRRILSAVMFKVTPGPNMRLRSFLVLVTLMQVRVSLGSACQLCLWGGVA